MFVRICQDKCRRADHFGVQAAGADHPRPETTTERKEIAKTSFMSDCLKFQPFYFLPFTQPQPPLSVPYNKEIIINT